MVIDRSDYFIEMQRRRIWAKARRVTINPDGTHFLTDDFGRIVRFHDFGELSPFGWMTVRMGA